MIFVQLSDYCWNMYKFTWYVIVYVCMLLGLELLLLFVNFEWK